jgi:uncharacterized BrkB/YihY/UPF0761 family membrane protein
MKNVLLTLLQFVLFLLVFAVSPILQIFLHLPSIVTKWADGTRGFQWEGILLMLALFVLILLIEALRKRIRSAGPWTVLALALAVAAGLAMKFGFMDLGS